MHAKLVVVGGDAKAAEIRLKLPTIVGRGRSASLTLPHPLVSRQHCEIVESDGRLLVRDLGSLNGTYIGNERITEAVLPPGELLTIGTVTFRAVYDEQASNSNGSSSASGPATPSRPEAGTRQASPPAGAMLSSETLGIDPEVEVNSEKAAHAAVRVQPGVGGAGVEELPEFLALDDAPTVPHPAGEPAAAEGKLADAPAPEAAPEAVPATAPAAAEAGPQAVAPEDPLGSAEPGAPGESAKPAVAVATQNEQPAVGSAADGQPVPVVDPLPTTSEPAPPEAISPEQVSPSLPAAAEPQNLDDMQDVDEDDVDLLHDESEEFHLGEAPDERSVESALLPPGQGPDEAPVPNPPASAADMQPAEDPDDSLAQNPFDFLQASSAGPEAAEQDQSGSLPRDHVPGSPDGGGDRGVPAQEPVVETDAADADDDLQSFLRGLQ